jgi:hypothetical protein
MGKHETEVSMRMYKACLPIPSLMYRLNRVENMRKQMISACILLPCLFLTSSQ